MLKEGIAGLLNRPDQNQPVLDVLRSIAILLVFGGHFAGTFQARDWVNALPVVHFGWTGVDLFFVLSGFLIGMQLLKELKRTGNIRIGRFLLRRGMRIWPLYYALILFLLVEIALVGRSPSGIVADTLYVSNYFHNQVGGGWSLSTEEQFYILAPLLLLVGFRVLKKERLWILPLAVVVCLNITRAIVIHHSSLPEADLRQKLYLPMYTHADGLAVGLLLAWGYVFRPAWLQSRTIRWLMAGALLCAGLGLYRVRPVLTNFTSLGLIYGAVTVLGLGLGSDQVHGILNWRGFYWISRLSYGMYLNHFGVLEHLGARLLPWRLAHGEVAFWLCCGVVFVVSLGLAVLTYLLVEWPFLYLRDRWIGGKPRKAAVAVGE